MSIEKIKESLIDTISKVTTLEPIQVAKVLTKPQNRAQNRDHGDLALPCFQVAKVKGISPPEAAKWLAENISLPPGITKATPVGPYLNFTYDRKTIFAATIPIILKEQEGYGRKADHGKTIIVEYSSPNIAKTFHVGHLRTTLIGHSLVQIYKHLGYKTIGINHLGDWGTQFGFVWAGCKLWGRPEQPTVDALVDIYRRATNLKKAQEENTVSADDRDKPDINQMARDYFISLEGGDKEATEFWQWCLDISLDYLKSMYRRMGIEFDHYTGESFYRDMLESVEQKIRDSGILEESRGALGVDCGKKLGFARVFTEDGRSLYITRDIATAMYRQDTFSPEKILYVVAAQQSLHFQQLIEILKRMKEPVSDKMVHVSFGFVPGMKTREGGGISLKDFLDESYDRALTAYRSEVQKRPEGSNDEKIAEAVAVGSMYFYFLSNSNVKDFHFSWDQALNFQGDSGPYLQYALARINSIEAKANNAGISLNKDNNSFNPDLLVEDHAYDLALLLTEFGAVIEKSGDDYEPYYIASYLLDLAKAFSRAYNELRVVDESVSKELATTRLSLLVAVKYVLASGLKLLGVPVVERM